jgi:ABC-type branched-subunit amino acid transport system substrate-binding protein
MVSLRIAFLLALAAVTHGRGEKPTNVVIGGLYPYNEDGEDMGMGSVIALENARNQSSGLEPLSWFKANPDVNITLFNMSSEGTQRGAFEGALSIKDSGAKLIIGPAYSTESVVVSLLANVFEFAIVSYASTSPRLSDKTAYPYFFRNVPSDNAQGIALAELVKFLKQTKCIVVHTDESYGLGLLTVFRERAALLNITIVTTITLPYEASAESVVDILRPAVDYVYDTTSPEPVKPLKDVGTFLFIGPATSGFVNTIKAAEVHNIIGAPFIWLASDGGVALTPSGEAVDGIKPESLKGLFGTIVAGPTSEHYRTAMKPRYEQLAREGYKVAQFGKTVALRPQPHVFAPYSYDAFMVAITALNTLYERELYNFTIAELREVLQATAYEGATGLNKFDVFQDREPVYDICNAKGDGEWTVIGAYRQNTTMIAAEQQIVFSDGSGVAPVFALPEPPFESGYIALIVIVILLVLALLIGALVWFVRRLQKQKRAAAALAANAEPLFWSADEEAEELGAVEKSYDLDNKLLVTTIGAEERSLYEVQRDASVPLFGVARGTRCAVNETLDDKMVLVNHSNQRVNYTITVPTSGDEYAFELNAKPGVGTLAPNEKREVVLRFKLLFTTKVQRWVKVAFEGADGAVYVALRVEGAVSTRIDPMELELYGKPIGEGAFGVVYRGKYRGTLVAAKVPRKQGEMKDSQLRSFQDEIALFEKLRSPYIVNFIGASHVPGRLCICTELLERGTVFELIHKAKVSSVLKVKMLIDASSALAYLHKNGVLYRDLKPDNLLVASVSHTAAVNCRLSDFGTAVSVADPIQLIKHTGSVGTPAYMAPELMANQPYNCKVDVYSLGMLSWEIFAETVPFSFLKRVWDLPRLVLEGMRPELPDEWPKGVREVISDCWLQAPEKRPSAEEAASAFERVFEPMRKDYEQQRKNRAGFAGDAEPTDGKGGVASKGRTAHTGQLDQIIEMGAKQQPDGEPVGDGKVQRAADLESKSEDPDRKAAKPKKKKPKKKAAEAEDE